MLKREEMSVDPDADPTDQSQNLITSSSAQRVPFHVQFSSNLSTDTGGSSRHECGLPLYPVRMEFYGGNGEFAYIFCSTYILNVLCKGHFSVHAYGAKPMLILSEFLIRNLPVFYHPCTGTFCGNIHGFSGFPTVGSPLDVGYFWIPVIMVPMGTSWVPYHELS